MSRPRESLDRRRPIRVRSDSPRCAHHRHRRVGTNDGARSAAARRGFRPDSRREVARRPGQHDLRLGVAEPHVVLDDLRAVGREHEPRVEHAAVVDVAQRVATRQRGLDDARRCTASTTSPDRRTAPASTRPCRRCSGPDRRRRRACSPARARAARPVRRRRRHSSESSGPTRPSSITTRRSRVAERRAGELLRARRRRPRRVDSVTKHALAGGETVGLHDVEARTGLEEGDCMPRSCVASKVA